MKVKYFPDTDTAYIEFSGSDVAETKSVNDNILLELGDKGNLVGMTIEHAMSQANIAEVSYQQMNIKTA